MSKKKINTNGTLLNLLLLGGAAVILKKRTGSLMGVGSTKIQLIEYLEERLNTLNRQMKYFQEKYSYPNIPQGEAYVTLLQTMSANVARQAEIYDILKKVRNIGIGATHSKEWIINYINHRLDVYDRQLPKLIDKNAIEKNVAVQEELHSILKHIYF